MKLAYNAGVVSQTMNIHVLDSSSTVGAGLTGIPATGVQAYYVRPRSAPVQITLVATGPTGPYLSGLWSEISSANMPGIYRVDIPNEVLATGPSVNLMFKGYTNMVPVTAEIQLDMPVGQVYGSVVGGVTGPVGSVAGSVGSVAGNVSGSIIGGVTGPVRTAGGFVDSVQGNITGSLIGGVTGPVRTAGGFVDSVQGNITGSLIGGVTGPVKFMQTMLGADSKALISTDTQDLKATLSVNVGAIAGDTTVPLKLSTGAGTMVISTAATGTLTTSAMTTNLSSTTDSIYVNRYVYFTSGSLTGEMAKIAAYNGTTKLITFSTTLTSAPSNNDGFIII